MRTRLPIIVLVACALAPALSAAPASARLVDRPAAREALAQAGARGAATRKITRPRWLSGVTVTEYFPVPEGWFVGARVRAPGIPGVHRIDWLYSARGLTMEGDGIGLDGRRYSVESVGRGGWVDRLGRASCIGCGGGVFWRAGAYYKNARGRLTFPLATGDWFNGIGVKWVPLPGVSFDTGPSLPLTYYRSVAVDPRVIPLGSRVYIPYYRGIAGGWFRAQDTGGAIGGRHVDVYRPPPPGGSGRHLTGQRIYVVPPRRAAR
jgi:hypothetical protein